MENTEEIWKDVLDSDNRYMVSNIGRVKSKIIIPSNYKGFSDGRVLRLRTNKGGYIDIRLSLKEKSVSFLVHRLVAKAFIPNPENKRCVNHKNGIKSDNRVENLEWCTHSENLTHALKTGLRIPKTSEAVRFEIVKLKQQKVSNSYISNLYNLSVAAIKKIYNKYKSIENTKIEVADFEQSEDTLTILKLKN